MRIGEIIATQSTHFVAESFELNSPPPLGLFVAVSLPGGSDGFSSPVDLFAVVTHGQTVGLDPGRHAMRRSTDVVFDDAVYREHPELNRTLRTEFQAALVGFSVAGQVRQHLPPRPPPLHFSVRPASEEEVRRFTDTLHYLRLLLDSTGETPPLQVLAANVREVYRQRGNDRDWLHAAAREIATLLKNDHEALLTVLYAIDPGKAPSLSERSQLPSDQTMASQGGSR
jgi:hypothetical protein